MLTMLHVLQVVVAEGAPRYGGHQHACKLAQAGINTTAIADSAIFAMMARVNKVHMDCVRNTCSVAAACLTVFVRSVKGSMFCVDYLLDGCTSCI